MDGVLGEVVVNRVVLAVRHEHAQILRRKMEVLSVLDLKVKGVTQKDVVINLFIFLTNYCTEFYATLLLCYICYVGTWLHSYTCYTVIILHCCFHV